MALQLWLSNYERSTLSVFALTLSASNRAQILKGTPPGIGDCPRGF